MHTRSKGRDVDDTIDNHVGLGWYVPAASYDDALALNLVTRGTVLSALRTDRQRPTTYTISETVVGCRSKAMTGIVGDVTRCERRGSRRK
jgi:hypothetical protein